MRTSTLRFGAAVLVGLASCAASRPLPVRYALAPSGDDAAISSAASAAESITTPRTSDADLAAAVEAATRLEPAPQGAGATTPWRARALGGYAFATGEDAADSEGQFGLDLGREVSPGVGVDVFWRGQQAPFDRQPNGTDCGMLNFLGLKATIESLRPGSAFYFWGGVGLGGFWSDDHLHDDSGLGLLGEGGVGYVLSESVRVRLGLGVEGFDTDLGRDDPADDGSSRWLWMYAPALQIEFRF